MMGYEWIIVDRSGYLLHFSPQFLFHLLRLVFGVFLDESLDVVARVLIEKGFL